jgi:hypothetical protein
MACITLDLQVLIFRFTGAYHMARWMAKVLYSLKIYLFREQFVLTVKENKNVTEFCIFASLVCQSVAFLSKGKRCAGQ